jgi:hypothetical protein
VKRLAWIYGYKFQVSGLRFTDEIGIVEGSASNRASIPAQHAKKLGRLSEPAELHLPSDVWMKKIMTHPTMAIMWIHTTPAHSLSEKDRFRSA